MAKKRKKKEKRAEKQKKSVADFTNTAFTGLGALTIEEKAVEPDKPQAMQVGRPIVQAEENESDEDAMFLKAVQEVELFESSLSPHQNPHPELKQVDEDAEARLELVGLVNGQLPFDISDTEEYVEGNIHGLPRKILLKLRKAEYAIQDRLDLHGMTRAEARELVEKFIVHSRSQGLRCVLIIHGRGTHSKDNIPVLKESLRAWFERGRGRIGGSVLAFSSARPEDGGLGAMYVLLRRRKNPN